LLEVYPQDEPGKPNLCWTALDDDQCKAPPISRCPHHEGATLPIKNVYFKLTGKTKVVARGELIKITTENPRDKRLTGHEGYEGKFYYGFRNLTWLSPISLSSLRFFNTGTPVPNEQPGACIIEEIG
jgi:hypothetical protein